MMLHDFGVVAAVAPNLEKHPQSNRKAHEKQPGSHVQSIGKQRKANRNAMNKQSHSNRKVTGM
jgi:hypothetical protein